MRYLRLAAWSLYLLDLVILLQLLYNLLTQRSGPEGEAALRGLAIILGPALLGVGVLLIVSSWLRNRVGLWIAMGLGAVPLFFALNAMIESLWG